MQMHQTSAFIMLMVLYLMKINASPATNLFELTKTLQPVVRRCLFGCPERTWKGGHETKKMEMELLHQYSLCVCAMSVLDYTKLRATQIRLSFEE